MLLLYLNDVVESGAFAQIAQFGLALGSERSEISGPEDRHNRV